MKRTLIGLMLVSALCFIFVGCGNSNTDSVQSAQQESKVEETGSAAEEAEAEAEKSEKTESEEIVIGDPVVIGDFTFYTEAWHRVTGQDSAEGEGYEALFYFDRSSEPFDINNYDWRYHPIKFDLEIKESYHMIMNSISGADEGSGHQGQFVFLYSIPAGQDLPQTATLVNENTGESAEIDLSGMIVVE